MSTVTMAGGSIHGASMDVFLLDYMTRGFLEENPSTMHKSYYFHTAGERQEYSTIMVISRDSWDDFKKWCQERCVTVHLKKRMIDSNKVWWPTVLEVLPGDGSIEHLVWVKLRYHY
jgi:hypothetical protein